MGKIRVAVVGYGNIGRYTLQALQVAPDMEIAGVVRRNGAENKPAELADYPVVKDIKYLENQHGKTRLRHLLPLWTLFLRQNRRQLRLQNQTLHRVLIFVKLNQPVHRILQYFLAFNVVIRKTFH